MTGEELDGPPEEAYGFNGDEGRPIAEGDEDHMTAVIDIIEVTITENRIQR